MSPDELARAGRLLNPRQSQQYSRALTLSRLALETVSQVPVRQIAFERSGHGKPSLPGSGLHFSYSHVADHAALAVCRSSPVGVDIERDRMLPLDPDLDHAFRSLEPVLRQFGIAERESAAKTTFYWTVLEAVSKCFGKSLREILTGADRDWLRAWAKSGENRAIFAPKTAPGLSCAVCVAKTVAELQLHAQSSRAHLLSV